MKNYVCTLFGLIGSTIACFFGGWTEGLTTLCIFMAVDLVTGVLLATVFGKSAKTDTGKYSTHVAAEGVIRKILTLILILVTHRLDIAMGTGNFIRDAVTLGFTLNETISIIENAGLMGLPIPAVLSKALHVLQEKVDEQAESLISHTENKGGE